MAPQVEVPVVAIIRAKAGKAKLLAEVLRGLVAPTQKEDGCLIYDLHRSSEDPDLFVFVEKWTSAETLKKHSMSPHLMALGARKEELISELQVIPLTPIEHS